MAQPAISEREQAAIMAEAKLASFLFCGTDTLARVSTEELKSLRESISAIGKGHKDGEPIDRSLGRHIKVTIVNQNSQAPMNQVTNDTW